MKMPLTAVMLSAILALSSTLRLDAQQSRHTQNREPISHHTYGHDKKVDDEYLMSHLDGDAGDLIGLVLPQRIVEMPHTAGRWEVAESKMAKVDEHTATSATIRLLHSGTTVVNYKYRYLDAGKEVAGSYPFTIRIHRVDAEAINIPSTIYVGLETSATLSSQIQLLPKYSEAMLTYKLDDPTIADLEITDSNTWLTGRKLGETTLYVEDNYGLHAQARIVVCIPELTSLDFQNTQKTMAPGETQQLHLKISPARAEPILTWSSEKPEIASVDENGVVTAHREGKTTIRVVSDNGKKESVTIKVK